jgi:hypothetical protein
MAATGDWVPDVTREAMRRLLAHAEKVGLPNTDECTLRAFFMAAAHDLFGMPGPRFQTEWKGFDLLVQIGALQSFAVVVIAVVLLSGMSRAAISPNGWVLRHPGNLDWLDAAACGPPTYWPRARPVLCARQRATACRLWARGDVTAAPRPELCSG